MAPVIVRPVAIDAAASAAASAASASAVPPRTLAARVAFAHLLTYIRATFPVPAHDGGGESDPDVAAAALALARAAATHPGALAEVDLALCVVRDECRRLCECARIPPEERTAYGNALRGMRALHRASIALSNDEPASLDAAARDVVAADAAPGDCLMLAVACAADMVGHGRRARALGACVRVADQLRRHILGARARLEGPPETPVERVVNKDRARDALFAADAAAPRGADAIASPVVIVDSGGDGAPPRVLTSVCSGDALRVLLGCVHPDFAAAGFEPVLVLQQAVGDPKVRVHVRVRDPRALDAVALHRYTGRLMTLMGVDAATDMHMYTYPPPPPAPPAGP